MPLRFPTAITAAALAALTTAAGAQQVARDDLVGTWSLDGTCASDYGMGLDGDGNVWFEDWGRGLWRFDGDTIHMILQKTEPGIDVVEDVVPVTLVIDPHLPATFNAHYVERGDTLTATRCD